MRYAFIADLHANLQAWRAVHRDIRTLEVDYILCLGDLVGYGPQPAELLKETHAHVDAFVLGNHDAVVAGKLAPDGFNPHARETIQWTRQRLNRKAAGFLSGLPLTLIGNGFRCAHGDFANPGNFDYVLNPEDAMPSWSANDSPLLLAGHTHDPALFVLTADGHPHGVEPCDFELEPGKRYFVNVGSAGHPRDNDPRASYCIYDTAANAVFWRRVAFDLDAYRQALQAAGLEERHYPFLRLDPVAHTPRVRAELDFAPPRCAAMAARDVTVSRDLDDLTRAVTRWRRVALGGLAGLGLLVLIGGWLMRSLQAHATVIGTSAAPVDSTRVPARQSVLPPIARKVPAGHPIPGWTVSLGDARRQSVSVHETDHGPAMVLQSDSAGEPMMLAGPVIEVEAGQSWYPEAMIRRDARFRGNLAMAVILMRATSRGVETNLSFCVKEPTGETWSRVRQRVVIPSGGIRIQFQLRGQFSGMAEIRNPVLARGGEPKPK